LSESGLQDKLRGDLREALFKKEQHRVSVLRLVLAGVQNAEIEHGGVLGDAGVVAALAKEAKRHRESIEAFKNGKRDDLVIQEEAELAVLLEYLPKQMSRDEIVEVVRSTIDVVGAKGAGDKGKVMGRLMPQLKGKADGQEVNAVVSELLAALSNE